MNRLPCPQCPAQPRDLGNHLQFDCPTVADLRAGRTTVPEPSRRDFIEWWVAA